MVKTSPGFSDGSGVGQHANSTRNLSQISSRNNGRWLIVDTDLEASWTPIDKLDRAVGLDGSNSSINVLGDNISTVEETDSHVLSVTRIAFDHLVRGLEAGVGDVADRETLVVGLVGGDDRGISSQGEVDTRVGDQVGLELSQINVQSAIETEGSGDRRNNLEVKQLN